jgi:hypothetical protein
MLVEAMIRRGTPEIEAYLYIMEAGVNLPNPGSPSNNISIEKNATRS